MDALRARLGLPPRGGDTPSSGGVDALGIRGRARASVPLGGGVGSGGGEGIALFTLRRSARPGCTARCMVAPMIEGDVVC